MEVKAAARPIPLVGQLAKLPVQLVELARSGFDKRSVGPQTPSIRLFSKGGLLGRPFLLISREPSWRCVFWTHSQDRAFYGAVSAPTEKVVEFFLERKAEAMIGEVREDEPELAVDLRVETIELG
jgi:hypothetical protein